MKLNKFFKMLMLVLIVVSVAILIWGFVGGFLVNDAQPVDGLLYWAYVMIGLALAGWVVVGGAISVKNNPKVLVKAGILLVALVVVCLIAYFLAPGTPAVGRENVIPADTHSVLKLTDTILNLTYIAGAAAILSIIAGEIRVSINNRK